MVLRLLQITNKNLFQQEKPKEKKMGSSASKTTPNTGGWVCQQCSLAAPAATPTPTTTAATPVVATPTATATPAPAATVTTPTKVATFSGNGNDNFPNVQLLIMLALILFVGYKLLKKTKTK